MMARIGLGFASILAAVFATYAVGMPARAQSPTVANTAQHPPPGGLTQTVAGTSDIEDLIAAQTFEVESIWVFDVAMQVYRVFVIGAPAFANTLTALSVTDIVQMRATRTSPAAPTPRPSPTPTPVPDTTALFDQFVVLITEREAARGQARMWTSQGEDPPDFLAQYIDDLLVEIGLVGTQLGWSSDQIANCYLWVLGGVARCP